MSVDGNDIVVNECDEESDFHGISDIDTIVEVYLELEDEDLYHGEEDHGADDDLPSQKSQRVNAAVLPKKLDDFVVGIAKIEKRDPITFKEAMKSVYREEWARAMDEEYRSLLSNNT